SLKNMKFFFNRILTVRKELNYLLLICVISISLYEFWLIKIPEFWPGLNVLGNYLNKICIAYITSYIFFFVNVHIESYKMKVRTFRYMWNKIHAIHSISIDLILSVKRAAGEPNTGPNNYQIPAKDALETFCNNIDPRQPVQL